jgi:hypothetical protein
LFFYAEGWAPWRLYARHQLRRIATSAECCCSKDQRSLTNRLLLMPHPIIHSQASNPALLHTVNNKQRGAVLSYIQ